MEAFFRWILSYRREIFLLLSINRPKYTPFLFSPSLVVFPCFLQTITVSFLLYRLLSSLFLFVHPRLTFLLPLSINLFSIFPPLSTTTFQLRHLSSLVHHLCLSVLLFLSSITPQLTVLPSIFSSANPFESSNAIQQQLSRCSLLLQYLVEDLVQPRDHFREIFPFQWYRAR